MLKKTVFTILAFILAGCICLGAGFAAEPSSGIRSLEAGSPCPATQCANGDCHGFDDVPEPDGVSEMACPETTCADVECHAWDSLVTGYRQASDSSLNVWVLLPVVAGLLVAALVRKFGK